MRVRRLALQTDIDRVRSQGQSHPTAWFVAIVARNAGGSTRIGVAAGKRVGGAVQRNRAKRLLREGVRPLYAAMQPGWDVLLLASSPILTRRLTQVTAHLEQALRRLKVIPAVSSAEAETIR